MLERITIKNLALISDAELELSGNLNVLSGETGAGKSIVVDALMLLMGGKYDKTMLSYGQTNGFVEGYFSFSDEAQTEFLTEYGLDADVEIIVTRKFSADGKNEIRINGKSVTAKMLKGIMSNFVDICGQNEYQVLANKKEHAVVLDAYARKDIEKSLLLYAQKYGAYQDLTKKLNSIGDESERARRIDMLSYQINEIENANVLDGEEDEILDFRNKALHSEKIKYALARAVEALCGENAGLDGVYESAKNIGQIENISAEYAELCQRLNSISVELDDVASSMSDLLKAVDFDENELDQAETRLALLRNIKKKYGDLSNLPQKLSVMKAELDTLTDSDEEYEFLQAERQRILDELYLIGKSLSDARRKCALCFENDVKAELETLGMKNSEFKVCFADYPSRDEFEDKLSVNGADDIEFLLSPNLGQPLLPLIKIISGGEMSRFMLALKVISSKYNSVSTLIFDEIDTGISGKIGQEVAKKLANISRYGQVLCVTHLPQIASMADVQYFIEKNTDGVTTKTNVKKLNREEMIDEISRLSGSRDISSASKQSAIEMKEWSEKYKTSIV